MRKTLFFFVIVLALRTQLAWSWDGAKTMVPGTIEVTDGGNYGFRIWGPSCGGVANFAYLQSTDSNYGTYVAVILMAKAQGLQLTFYTNKDSNGYCHIGYVSQQ
jgi:hypothetical protein